MKLPSLIAVSLLLLSCGSVKKRSTIPDFKTDAWFSEIEIRSGISDGEGHGPDRLSEEWCMALNKKVSVADSAGHGPDICSDEWLKAIEKRLF